MKIETRKIILSTYHLEKKGNDLVISSPRGHKSIIISPLQAQLLSKLAQDKTIEDLVLESLSKDEDLSFRELYKLIEILLSLEIITDSFVRNYFDPAENHNLNHGLDKSTRVAPTSGESLMSKWSTQRLVELPFFRNLPDSLLRTFIAHAELLEVPERTKIINAGDKNRDLFVIFQGEASIYIPGLKHRQLITTIPAGSVFGEGGFFFGHSRSADVISNVPTVYVKIKYDDKDFHSLIHAPGTNLLQQRLWILHGLLSSPLFHHVPAETMDRFVLAGKLRTLKYGETLFKQGEPGNSFFVLIQGQLDIVHNNKVVKSLKQGDLFGEVALMINQGERTATAMSRSDGLLLEVHRDEFFKVLAQNLILAKEIEDIAHRRYNNMFA